MIILPAIDIKDNKCVRLTQGDFNKVKVYSTDPLDIALQWQEQGAKYLHLVDLDGAESEDFVNRKSLEKILKTIDIPIQVGGGIRSKAKVELLLNLGAKRIILGTIAIEDPSFLESLILQYGSEKIVVSIDAKNRKVATRGWQVITEVDSLYLCKKLETLGIQTIVYTDISKDGMLQGPNFRIYEELMAKTQLNVIVSGGVSYIENIRRLKTLNPYGVIIGKALYDGILDFKEVIQWQE